MLLLHQEGHRSRYRIEEAIQNRVAFVFTLQKKGKNPLKRALLGRKKQ